MLSAYFSAKTTEGLAETTEGLAETTEGLAETTEGLAETTEGLAETNELHFEREEEDEAEVRTFEARTLEIPIFKQRQNCSGVVRKYLKLFYFIALE